MGFMEEAAAAVREIQESSGEIPPIESCRSDPLAVAMLQGSGSLSLREIARHSARLRAEALMKTLPAVIRIGAHDYEIALWSPIEAEQRQLHGHHSHLEMKLRLAPSFATATYAAQVFLHECLHALYDARALAEGDKQERIVDSFATGLVTLFRDNPWLTVWLAGAVK